MRLTFLCVSAILILCSSKNVVCQSIDFNEVSLDHGVYVHYDFTYLGEGVSFFDFDEDGWDDLTICQTNGPVILYRNNNGYFEPQYYFFAGQQAISSCWGDLDNDGFNDLVITTYDNGIRFFKNINNNDFTELTDLQNIPIQQENLYTGIAFGDMNRDGLLDIAIANFSIWAKNVYLMNQGNFVFEQIQGESQFVQTQKNAFQHAFIDLDKNLWPDIYVINDFYQGNDYYKNLGNFNFSDNDSTLGLFVKADAMSNSWNDYDNDGDMDLYVTNRYFGNHFMKQIDSLQFENIANASGADLARWCWSATWIDVDNNNMDDLLITQNSNDVVTDTSGNRLYLNVGNDIFHQYLDTTIFPVNGFACSVGDFNNDGKSDLALSTRQGYDFQLYKNISSHTNNYFKFKLEGRISNRNGIGTHYEIWTQGLRQYGYTQSGENYLAQNSQNYLLGIGNATIIDSVILYWPSGTVDKFYDLPANQMSILQESENLPWYNISDTILCNSDDTIWIEIALFTNPTWWDQTTSSKKAITEPGTYTFSISTSFNQIQNFTLQINNPTENLVVSSENNYCPSALTGNIIITDTLLDQTVYLQSQLDSGEYPIALIYLGCPIDTVVSIETLDNWNWDLPDTIWTCEATIPDWNYWDNLSANSLITEPIEQTENLYLTTWQNPQGCARDTLLQVYVPASPSIIITSSHIPPSWLCQLEISGNDGPYTTTGLDWENGSILIENPGNYPFNVIDGWGCTYTDTLSISPITEISSFKRANEIWLYDPPYLIGPNTDDIRIINSIGQQLPTKKAGNFWLIPENTSPRWVHSNGSFYNIGWIMRK